MKYLLLDVAGTILHKPDIFTKIHEVLNRHGYSIGIGELKHNHKLLSEVIKFPDAVTAQHWFQQQDFSGATLLLKGSRSMKMEKVLE